MNEAIEIHFVRGYKFDDCVINCKSTKINKFKSLLLEYISQKYIELFVIFEFSINYYISRMIEENVSNFTRLQE